MSSRKLILILLSAAVLFSAGCVTDSSDNTTNSSGYLLNPLQTAGELRGMYLNYVDSDTGDSWWVHMKTKVGTSVLSLRGPNLSMTDEVLTEDKLKILNTALELSGADKMSRWYIPPEKLSETGNVTFWVEYALGHSPYYSSIALPSTKWESVWPALRSALVEIAGTED